MLKHSLAILIATAVPAMAADAVLSSHKVQFEHEILYLRGDKSGFGESRPLHSFDPDGKIHPGVRARCDRPECQELGHHVSHYLRRSHAAANHCPLTPQAVLGVFCGAPGPGEHLTPAEPRTKMKPQLQGLRLKSLGRNAYGRLGDWPSAY